MKNSQLTIVEALTQLVGYVSSKTISQMLLDKKDEVTIRNDGAKVYMDIKTLKDHHPLKISRKK